ncbi:MAG: shikimate dehydrogenase [Chlorobiaceae bacterium]|nr:shikimate dehydrogenase [Chlorobiaceae bacterium]NTV60482.1 shikimate dehydrogenase [Chlorobiaceae bacterium]
MTKAKKILGLIGRGIDYSYSPLIHNTAIEALGLPYFYTIFNIADHSLVGDALKGAAALGIAGLNVTIPYKQTVVASLDELSEEASSIKAVNTIVNTEGRLCGHNTDIAGFASPLQQYREAISGRTVCIFGSGGAALAAIEAFRKFFSPAGILLFVRDTGKAALMLDHYAFRSAVTPMSLKELHAGNREYLDRFRSCAVVVNATPLGTKGRADDMKSIIPLDAELFHKDQIVYDMVYNPFETPLLAAAKKAGAETVPGIEMLIGQAARSFELWTGSTMPLDIVRKRVLEAIGAKA